MSLEDIADIATIVGVALALAGALFAYRQLKAATAASESGSILALDEAFARFEGVRRKINMNESFKTRDERVELRRYLALWERLGLLLDNRTVKLSLVDQIYGSRFEALLKRDDPKQIVKDSPRGWRNFIALWRRFHSEGLRNLPDPPPMPPRWTDRRLTFLSMAAVVLAVVAVIAFGLNLLDVAEDALEEEPSQGGPRRIGDDLFVPLAAGLIVSSSGLLAALGAGLRAPSGASLSREASTSSSESPERAAASTPAAVGDTADTDEREKASWWTRVPVISGCLSSAAGLGQVVLAIPGLT